MVSKVKKSINIFLIILFIIPLVDCAQTLKVNQKKYFSISKESVQINFSAKSDMRFFYIVKIKSKQGNIEVHPVELRLTSIPLADTIKINGFYYKKKNIKQSFILNQGETCECRFSIYPKIKEGFIINEIHILPGDFIIHQGAPLITDTIKIKVR